MPRKAKVQAVPVEQVLTVRGSDQGEGLVVAQRDEKTEAEQLTEVTNEVYAKADEVDEPVVVLTQKVTDQGEAPIETKLKAKRVPKAKAKAEAPPDVVAPPCCRGATCSR